MYDLKWFDEVFNEFEIHRHFISELIYSEQTEFQKIEIYQSPVFGKMLVLDGEVQSSELDEFIYHESLVHPAMILHPHPRKVGIIGGGEGSTLREVLKHSSVTEVTMIDIDKKLIATSKALLKEFHQNSFDDPRLKLVYSDARKFLENSQKNYFDVIISDIVEPYDMGPASFLFTHEFYQIIRNTLTENGIFAHQASHLRITDYHLHCSIRKTLEKMFPVVKSFAAYVPSFDTNWSFIIANQDYDPCLLSELEINNRLVNRLVSDNLKFYDGETHHHIFKLSKYIREIIGTQGRIISDNDIFSFNSRIIKQEGE